MSPLERPVPPAGEEIHIPEGSVQPILLTIGITVALLGLTIDWILVAVGTIITVGTLVVWVKDARREYATLPLDHHPVVGDTVPSPEHRPDH